MRTWIAPKMTPVLQPTDTDFSYRLKAFATQEGRTLKEEMREARVQAVEEGCEDMEMTTWGSRELLEIVHRSLKKMHRKESEEKLTLKSLDRNGFLTWRPCMKTRTLKDCKDEEWRKDLPWPEPATACLQPG